MMVPITVLTIPPQESQGQAVDHQALPVAILLVHQIGGHTCRHRRRRARSRAPEPPRIGNPRPREGAETEGGEQTRKRRR